MNCRIAGDKLSQLEIHQTIMGQELEQGSCMMGDVGEYSARPLQKLLWNLTDTILMGLKMQCIYSRD